MSANARPKRNPLPGKQKITREKWDRMLAAFRTHGENHDAVVKECGVSWSTSKRAWGLGWEEQIGKEWAIPIKNVIAADNVRVRAAFVREERNEADDYRKAKAENLQAAIDEGFTDLVHSRRKAGKVVRAARDNSLAALIVSQKLLKAAIPLADLVVKQLDEDKTMSVHARMGLLQKIARFGKDTIEIAQVTDEMERKALGEPDKILAVQHGLSMDVEEAKETLEEIGEVLQLYSGNNTENTDDGNNIDAVIEAEFDDTTPEDDDEEGEIDDQGVKLDQVDGEIAVP